MNDGRSSSRSAVRIILVNVILAVSTVALFVFYTARYRERLKVQNIDDITNINQSSANISSAFFQNQERSISDDLQYITRKGFGLQEAMAYIRESNSVKNGTFELIGSDCRGYGIVGGDADPVPLDYTSNDYRELKKIFEDPVTEPADGIFCTPEFTDQCTTLRSFALYDHIRLAGSDEVYTLMAVFESRDFAGLIELDGGYKDIATALMTGTGDYVLSADAFKSDNLFKYFYEYNGLTLDEKNQALSDFASGDRHIFYYRNSRGQDSVFIITAVQDTQWYCVTCVPITSFRSTSMDIGPTVWMAILLLSMMVFNLFWLNQSNRRLRLSNAREIEASAAKTDFLSRMSHDIRTPLNGIIGMTYLAREQDNPPKTEDYLNKIDTSSKFLLSLINDILDLSKAESNKIVLHPEPYLPAEFNDYLNAVFVPQCQEKKQKLVISAEGLGDSCPVVDKLRLNQVIFNLLSNAVKYTPEGGSITCTADYGKPDGNGRMKAVFRVSDTGIGMSEEFQKHLFEPFTQESQTVMPARKGTGLGLAIAKKIVDLMDGTITAESRLGSGTTFTVSLQMDSVPMREAVAAAARPEPTDSFTSLRGKRVLLCEDQPLNQEIVISILKEKGIETETADNGRKGLEMVSRAADGYYDLILMDMQMPVMDGLEATRQIRALDRAYTKRVPILAMTANAFDDDVRRCLDAGMDGHIAKPIDPAVMFRTIAAAIGKNG